jgi:small redox-active disulfide protein 2
MNVQVYGTGCANCQAQEKTANKAINELEVDMEVEKIGDIDKILEVGLLSFPGFCSGQWNLWNVFYCRRN